MVIIFAFLIVISIPIIIIFLIIIVVVIIIVIMLDGGKIIFTVIKNCTDSCNYSLGASEAVYIAGTSCFPSMPGQLLKLQMSSLK